MYKVIAEEMMEDLTLKINTLAEEGYRVIWIEKSSRTAFVFVLMTNDENHSSLTGHLML